VQRSRPDASHLRAADLFALAGLGLRIRRLRAALSALGICIGIAAIVGVLGITQSSESDLVAQIDRLGTNLLTVQNGRSFNGAEGTLPQTAPGMIGHMAGVEHVSATALLAPSVYRTDRVPAFETGGIGVRAADGSLLSALDGSLLHGAYLNAATSRYQVAILGFGAAQYLGIDRIDQMDVPARVWIAGRWFVVAGILNRMPLAPEIDQSVLVGWPIAESELAFDGYPTRIYVRAATDQVVAVDNLLAATANPQAPEQVAVSRPSDALAARIAVVSSSTTLVLGLGAIALLVGGVGIANVMFVSVLERRSEIGLRRALGATRGHIAVQFLAESLLLSSLGGAAGVAGALGATAAYATLQGWSILVPPLAIESALAAAIFIGVVAGLYPALRAARLSPTEALRSA
jgi:putative ABC transport system permease protein